MRIAGLILVAAIALQGCKGSNTVTTTNGDTKREKIKLACGDMHVDPGKKHLDWKVENSSVFTQAKEVLVLPREYGLYSLDSTQMAEFFYALKNNQDLQLETVLPLPAPADCQMCTIRKFVKDGYQDVGTTITATGDCGEQELRATYVNGVLNMRIKWYDLDYAVTPVTANGKTYYIVYTKAADKSKQDQARPSNPEIVELKYDK